MINCIRRNDQPADWKMTGVPASMMLIFIKLRLCNTKCSKLNQETNQPNQLSIQSSRKIFQVYYFYPLNYYFPASHLLYMMREVIITSDSTTAWGELCSRSTSFFFRFLFTFYPSATQWPPSCLTNRLTFWSLPKSLICSIQLSSQTASSSLLNLPEKNHLNQCPASSPNQSAPSKFNCSFLNLWIWPPDRLQKSIHNPYLPNSSSNSPIHPHFSPAFLVALYSFFAVALSSICLCSSSTSPTPLISLSHSLILSH